MKTLKWSFSEKFKELPYGPWSEEPDKVQWEDENTGFPCLAVRSHLGMWCGYVGVSEGHPYYGLNYDNVGDLTVHGGLTYSDFCQGTICHEVEEDEDDKVFWLGFDCGHGWDLIPQVLKLERDMNMTYSAHRPYEEYRTLDYVQEQCRHLAEQLIARQSQPEEC